MGEIGDQVLDHFHVRQRGDADVALQVLDRGGAGEAVAAIHVHRAGTADAFAAGAAEGQRRVLLRLHLDQRVEHHRPAGVEIDLERIVARILAAVGIVAIDRELADPAEGYEGAPAQTRPGGCARVLIAQALCVVGGMDAGD
jgi:hypothetical protein